MKRALAWLVAVATAAFPLVAHADFIGESFSATYYFPDTSSPYPFASFAPPSFTVGAGTETVGDVEGVTFIAVDFAANTIGVAFSTVLTAPTWNAAAFNGIVLTASAPHGITGATVDGSSTMPGFGNADVTFNATQIFLNWQGLSYVDGTVLNITFGFAPVGVPEPGTLALLALVLAGLAFVRPANATRRTTSRRRTRPASGPA
jgi:hypothetical protein